MQIQIVSDLHIDTHHDSGTALLERICQTEADVLIIAGDFSEVRLPEWLDGLKFLASHYPQVITVLGNHEYFHSTPPAVEERWQVACRNLPNLQVLENQMVAIAGVRIAGTTLWYRQQPENHRFEHLVGDFRHLDRHWIYDRNQQAIAFLQSVEADIWVCHHLPSWKSVHPNWIGSETNRFFVCDLEPLIEQKQPQLLIHGHTHYPTHYAIGQTQVICNPFGYPGESHSRFNPQLVVSLKHQGNLPDPKAPVPLPCHGLQSAAHQ